MLKRIIRIFEYSNSYVRIVLFVFVFVSNFLCLSIRYSIRLLGKFLTIWLTQTLKFRRVPLLILPEFQPKIRIFELWSPNSDIRIRIRRISNDVKLFVFVFIWFSHESKSDITFNLVQQNAAMALGPIKRPNLYLWCLGPILFGYGIATQLNWYMIIVTSS